MSTLKVWKGRPILDVRTTGHLRVKDLMRDLGDFEIPPFQRGYVWGETEALALIDSLMRGFPIGNILLWYPDSRSSLGWPTGKGIVLDGQQRLTTLSGALLPRANTSDSQPVPRIAFDADANDFVIVPEGQAPGSHQFILSEYIQQGHIPFDEYRRIWAEFGEPEVPPDDRDARMAAVWQATLPGVKVPTDFATRPRRIPAADWNRFQAAMRQSDLAREKLEKAITDADPGVRRATEIILQAEAVIDRLSWATFDATIISGGTLDDAVEVFKRTNTAGRPLNEEGIRALLTQKAAQGIRALLTQKAI